LALCCGRVEFLQGANIGAGTTNSKEPAGRRRYGSAAADSMDCGVWCALIVEGQKRRAGGQRYEKQKWRVANFFGGQHFAGGRAGTACRAPAERRNPYRQTKGVARLLLMDDNAGWPGGSLT
jgi:hypothetical protein